MADANNFLLAMGVHPDVIRLLHSLAQAKAKSIYDNPHYYGPRPDAYPETYPDPQPYYGNHPLEEFIDYHAPRAGALSGFQSIEPSFDEVPT